MLICLPGRSPPGDTVTIPQLRLALQPLLTTAPSRRGLKNKSAPVGPLIFQRIQPPLAGACTQAPTRPKVQVLLTVRSSIDFQPRAIHSTGGGRGAAGAREVGKIDPFS